MNFQMYLELGPMINSATICLMMLIQKKLAILESFRRMKIFQYEFPNPNLIEKSPEGRCCRKSVNNGPALTLLHFTKLPLPIFTKTPGFYQRRVRTREVCLTYTSHVARLPLDQSPGVICWQYFQVVSRSFNLISKIQMTNVQEQSVELAFTSKN